MKQPRAFCEIPAGLASVSLALQGGKHCKPPVSRCGAKTNYSHVILDAMGLRPGQGAQSYWWTEADPDVRALLCAYTQPDLLRAVAEVLRGWVGEEPRALWTRLRDERKARATRAAVPVDYQVAEWMFLHHGSCCFKGIDAGIGSPQGGDHNLKPGTNPRAVPTSRDIVEAAALRLSRGPGWPPVAVTAAAPSAEEVAGWLAFVAGSHPGSDGFRGLHCNRPSVDGFIPNRANQAAAVANLALPWPPTLVTARAPEVEALAGWAFVVGNSWRGHGDHWREPCDERIAQGVAANKSIEGLSADFGALASVSTRPTEPTPGVDLEGCIIYADPPYFGTTPYAYDMPRAEVVRLATEYAAAGALVVVSEATPIPELTALGWEAINIAGERKGQRRTFSADGGANEWLTMSRPPTHRPAIQAPLFAVSP